MLHFVLNNTEASLHWRRRSLTDSLCQPRSTGLPANGRRVPLAPGGAGRMARRDCALHDPRTHSLRSRYRVGAALTSESSTPCSHLGESARSGSVLLIIRIPGQHCLLYNDTAPPAPHLRTGPGTLWVAAGGEGSPRRQRGLSPD